MSNKQFIAKVLMLCSVMIAFGAAIFSVPAAADEPVIIPLATEEPVFNGYIETSSGRPILFAPNDPNYATWYNVWVGTPDFATQIFYGWIERDNSKCDATFCTIIPDAHPSNGTYSMWIQTWGPSGYNSSNNDPNYWRNLGEFTVSLTAPGLTSGVSTAVNSTTVTASWLFTPHATWYNIWLGKADFSSQAHYQWYSAIELGCNGSGTCTLSLPKTGLESGAPYLWYIQSWGPGGFSQGGDEGGWSHTTTFTP